MTAPMKKKIFLALLIVLTSIQFIRPDRSVPEVNEDTDLFAIYRAPEEVKTLVKNACYDCHSYETTYPWYAQVAPVSWYLNNHVNEGREHLNFTTWGEYEPDRQGHKLEEIIDEVKEGKMPLKDYTWLHEHARLSREDIYTIATWFHTLQ